MRSIKRDSSPHMLVALLAVATLLGLVSQNAMALTASGTTISNNATLTYNVGGVDPTGGTGVTAAVPATFVVDNKVITLVTGGITTTVVSGATTQATKFTVTNTGNTSQSYNLTASLGLNGFTNPITSGYTIYYDTDASGTFTAGDTVYVDGAYTLTTLAPTMTVFVVADIPAANLNGETSTVVLTATATTAGSAVAVVNSAANTAGVDIVLADAAGTAAGDVAYDGKHSATNIYSINSGSVTVTKTATLLCDPIVGDTTATPHHIPGAVVRYAITIANGGATSVGLTSLSDTLAASLATDSKLIDGIGTAAPLTTCASATGNSLSASGFRVITGAGVGPGTIAAATATTAGATATAGAGGTVSIDFTTLADIGGTKLTASVAPETGASLPSGSYITVFFNAVIQ